MSGPEPVTPRCEMCDEPSAGQYPDGYHLCDRHLGEAVVKRSDGPRDSYEGGLRRPFDVVPENSLEQVHRDVTVTYENVPLWAVEALFARTQKDLGHPDIDEVEAHLVVKYSNLDERTYERLDLLRESYSWHGEPVLEITRTRLYPPRHLAEQRMREVDKERSEKPRE